MDIIKKDKNLPLKLIKDLPVLPRPYARDIYLFSTHVAGTSHAEGIDGIVRGLKEGDELRFLREPENMHDKLAIAVITNKDEKIGYVPRFDNPVFARLLDAGKLLFGKIKAMSKIGNWHKIEIDIYLRD